LYRPLCLKIQPSYSGKIELLVVDLFPCKVKLSEILFLCEDGDDCWSLNDERLHVELRDGLAFNDKLPPFSLYGQLGYSSIVLLLLVLLLQLDNEFR
jgi:hypothetical protein